MAAAAAAAPATTANPDNVLMSRMTDSCSWEPGSQKLGDQPYYLMWTVNVAGAKYYTKDECGSGFLDNFRGRCGAITNWGCDYVPDTADAKMSFWTSIACTNYDITQAIKASTNGERTVDCYDPK